MSAALTILRAIHRQERLSRTELTRATSLGASTVSLHVKHLIKRGAVRETGTLQNPLGRPSIVLELDPSFAYVVGVYHDQRRLTGVVANLSGDIVGRGVREIPDPTPESFVTATADLVNAVVADAAIGPSRVAGVGIAMSGLVDGENGVCITSTVLGWSGVPLASLLSERVRYPVVLENDVNAMTVASRYFGLARARDSVAVVALGEGVGGGLHLNGELVRGRAGVAGEIGHLTIDPDGEACACGKRGCLESIASARVLRSAAARHGWSDATLAGVRQRASTEAVAARLYEGIVEAIGISISHVVNLLNPSSLIVIDKGIGLDHACREHLTAAIERHMLPSIHSAPEIAFETTTDDAWALGAASLCTRALLEGRWSTIESMLA